MSDIWIVDNGTNKVVQYYGAATRTSGSQNAGATFALAAGNTNPQGIADPPPGLLMTPAGLPLALDTLPAAALTPPGSSRVPSLPAFPALGSRDAVFSLLTREPLPGPDEPALDLLADGALIPYLDRPASAADRAWTPAGNSGGPNFTDRSAALASGSSQGFLSDGGAVGLLDGLWANEAS